MAQRVRDILLRIRGDSSDAENDLHQLARELHKFDGIHAEATADINTQAAERKIASAKNAMQAFGRMSEEAKVDLQTRAAQVKLDGLKRNLENLQRKPVTPKVELAVGRTVAQIERIEAQLDRLERRRVDIDVDVGRGVGGAIAGATGAAAQGLGLFIGTASRGIPIIGQLGAGLVAVGLSSAALGPIMLALVPIIGIFLLNAVIMLTGAVVALGASLLTAAAGVGVLGIALAAAFGPVILVAIAAMARFAKILEAVKAAEDKTATSAKDAGAALQAQAAQAEAVEDAVRGIAQAELSREQAALGVEQAELALKQFREEAELTDTSLDGLFKKFTDVSFRPESLIRAIQGSAVGEQAGPGDELQLQQLILNLRSARLSEQAAIDGVSDAHDRLADARSTETAAIEKQDDKLKGLTDTERDLVDVIVELKKTLTDAFRPATQAIFDGVIAFFGDLSDFAKDSRVRGGLTAIGRAIGGMFREFGRVLRNRETREAFGEISRAAGRMIRAVSPMFTALFRLVMRIATVAMPWLEQVIGDITDAVRNWADAQDKSGIEGFVRRVRRSFNIWKDIVVELWRIIKAFFGDANDSGDKLARRIRRILINFREWLDENPDAIKQFFQDAAKFAADLAYFTGQVVGFLRDIKQLWKDIGEIKGPSGLDVLGKVKGFWDNLFGTDTKGAQTGGLIPGVGSGDIVPAMLEPGEYVIRRSVAQAIGVPRLNLLNAGNLGAIGMSRGGSVNIENINLPAAPGHGQLGDPRHQAVQLARELRRRGGQSITGGGVH